MYSYLLQIDKKQRPETNLNLGKKAKVRCGSANVAATLASERQIFKCLLQMVRLL